MLNLPSLNTNDTLALEKSVYKLYFYEFFKAAWHVIEPLQELQLNWHHKYICDLLEQEFRRWEQNEPKEKDIIINVPPRSTKTIIVNVCYPVWCWINQPAFRIISSSTDDQLANNKSQLSRDLINSTWFKQLFGDIVEIKKGDNQKSKYSTTQTGVRMSVGTGSNVTGEGANLYIYDDTLNPEKVKSTKKRETAINWYKGTSYSRLNDQQRDYRVIIEQRLHQEDLTGYLTKNHPNEYRHIVIDALKSDDVNPPALKNLYEGDTYDIKRFPKQELNKLAETLGDYEFTGQYRQRPTPKGGKLIKTKYFKTITYKRFLELIGNYYVPRGFLDTAYTEKETNSASAMGSFVFHKGRLYILSIKEAWLEFPELCDAILAFNKEHLHKNSQIRVEPKASGKSVVQALKRIKGINIVEGDAPTSDKVEVASTNQPFVESGNVYLVEGSWIPNFLAQCETFPLGTHDDQVDILQAAITFYTNQTENHVIHVAPVIG